MECTNTFALYLQSQYYDMPAFQAAGRDGLSTTFHGKTLLYSREVFIKGCEPLLLGSRLAPWSS